ncbi:MAG: AhpC/TSA family protein [Bacteroidetes bacterium]|nr:AhpC/TSA family protein [Bacteroidota bacterium]
MKKTILYILLLVTILSFTTSTTPEGLNLNEMAPNFTSTDQNGKTIILKELLKKGSVVMVFYRGEWCPYCNKQLMLLQDSLALITKKGASLIAVSPEKAENIAKTIQKTRATYSVLSDDSLKIMSAYKVAFALDEKTTEKYKGYGINLMETNGSNGNNLPVPAVYIINKEGKIIYRYFDVNYKNRVSVSEILKHL